MKFLKPFSLLLILSTLLTSCYAPSQLVDDDVYVVKNSALPVGESLTDETSYATYRHRNENNTLSSNYYQEEHNYLYNNHCYNTLFWSPGCGCSFYAWNVYNNMHYNPYAWGYGHPYGFGSGFNGMMYDPYFGSFVYNPFFNPYGYYGYGFNPYFNNYYGGYNGYGNQFTYTPAPQVLSNHHVGPRGGFSGYSDPSGRMYTNTVKMNTSGGTVPQQRTSSFERQARSREILPSNTPVRSTTYRPVGRTIRQVGTSEGPTRNIGTGESPQRQQRGGEQQIQRGGNSPAPRSNSSSPAPARSGGGNTPSGRRN